MTTFDLQHRTCAHGQPHATAILHLDTFDLDACNNTEDDPWPHLHTELHPHDHDGHWIPTLHVTRPPDNQNHNSSFDELTVADITQPNDTHNDDIPEQDDPHAIETHALITWLNECRIVGGFIDIHLPAGEPLRGFVWPEHAETALAEYVLHGAAPLDLYLERQDDDHLPCACCIEPDDPHLKP